MRKLISAILMLTSVAGLGLGFTFADMGDSATVSGQVVASNPTIITDDLVFCSDPVDVSTCSKTFSMDNLVIEVGQTSVVSAYYYNRTIRGSDMYMLQLSVDDSTNQFLDYVIVTVSFGEGENEVIFAQDTVKNVVTNGISPRLIVYTDPQVFNLKFSYPVQAPVETTQFSYTMLFAQAGDTK